MCNWWDIYSNQDRDTRRLIHKDNTAISDDHTKTIKLVLHNPKIDFVSTVDIIYTTLTLTPTYTLTPSMDRILGKVTDDEDGIHVTSLSSKGIKLNAEHAIVPGVPGVNMYRYQLATISAIRDIEYTREFPLSGDPSTKIKVNALTLANGLGSGKTYCVHGFIKLYPIPRAFPDHIYIPDTSQPRYGVKPKMPIGILTSNKIHQGVNEVQIKYTNFIKPTIIVVGSGVLEYWIETAKKFNMRYFAIGDVRDLRKFYEVFKANNINIYDEIIVKNGTVTTNFVLDDEDETTIQPNSIRPIIEVLKLMTRKYCWSRAVYDDFDTVRIPPTATTFPALFTIYVSATLSDEQARKPLIYDGDHSKSTSSVNIVDQILNAGKMHIKDVPNDVLLHKFTTIKCDLGYIDDCTKMPKAFKKVYMYTHSGRLFMEMLDKMGVDDAKEILEMISGDAINTAAGRLGIQTNSVADIAKKVLNDNFDKYKSLTNTLSNIRKYYELINELPEHPDGDYGSSTCDRITNDIIHKKTPSIDYYSSGVLSRLDAHYTETSSSVDKLAASIKRVQDNFREGECIVCLNSLVGMTVFISTCCNVVLCGPCLTRACRFRVARDNDSGEISGMCPKCRTSINLKTQMIALDAGFDPSSLLNADPLDISEPPVEPTVDTLATPKSSNDLPQGDLGMFDDVSNPKIRALLNIIHGIPIKSLKTEDLMLPNLLYGNDDRPVPPDDTTKRVLVFASFDETLDNVKKELRARSIPCDTLGGTHHQLSETIKRFEQSGKVLLINSKHYCAGINLQFCTEVVFMHKINNEHCEQQVCGRAQRIGRKYNLTVHYLAYENERV